MNVICKSSASIKPEWVARWGFRQPPCEELTAAGVHAVAEIESVREKWDVGAFELELKPGFGPDGPIGTGCKKWCGERWLAIAVPINDQHDVGAGRVSAEYEFCYTEHATYDGGKEAENGTAYCTQACLDRAQAKVAVPAEPTRVLATGWVDAFAMVETTDRARCAGATNWGCLAVPRWQKITTPPSGYWHCDYHAEERGAFADAKAVKDLGNAAERHGRTAPGSVNETTQAPPRQGVNPSAGGQAAVTCKAPGFCSTACWRVQRHVEKPEKAREEWRAPKHDIIPWADDRIHSARPDAATFSKVATLPPKPIDASRELAHMKPRWPAKRYER